MEVKYRTFDDSLSELYLNENGIDTSKMNKKEIWSAYYGEKIKQNNETLINYQLELSKSKDIKEQQDRQDIKNIETLKKIEAKEQFDNNIKSAVRIIGAIGLTFWTGGISGGALLGGGRLATAGESILQVAGQELFGVNVRGVLRQRQMMSGKGLTFANKKLKAYMGGYIDLNDNEFQEYIGNADDIVRDQATLIRNEGRVK